MDVGIGLPNATRGVSGAEIVAWAREAEQAGFSTLGTIDRIAYENFEPLVSLAAAAAVTERIRLATTIMLAPLRANTVLLAKQAASVDALSGGRLVLGLAVGGREDDYELSGIDFHRRGRIFDRQLEQLRELWDGDEVGPSPANPGGPTVIVGGAADAAFRRAARYASGWMQGGGTADAFKDALPKLEAAWREAGRDGEPRKMALGYYSLGANAKRNAEQKLGHYYGWLGEYARQIVEGAAKDADSVKRQLATWEEMGCDEFVFFPSDSDPEQVGLLREALG